MSERDYLESYAALAAELDDKAVSQDHRPADAGIRVSSGNVRAGNRHCDQRIRTRGSGSRVSRSAPRRRWHLHQHPHVRAFRDLRPAMVQLFMAWIGYPILGQFSISYWWKKHNNGHHRVPNVIGVDQDCDFMPLFAYCERGRGRARVAVARLYFKYQGVFLPILILLHGLNIQTYDWRYLSRTA